ncbi:MAG: hypothetical protein KIC84_16010 [Dysgonomonas mossii]|uniref:phage head spike fiber domain-containing protein n=1 Tax=Dysgonomonas mossii TaxID=163665 RepID=UPI0026EB86E6|nr:hypothetical protein [Dysgonomonas mossii]MBS5908714.1 hypothetical protein [Dysgonomonas mossii]
MSIKIGGTDISRVYKGTTLINKIYAGDKLVFSRYENAIDNYASIIDSLGSNGQDAIDLYNTIPNDVRSNAKVILMPFTVAVGVVYAMDNITGDLVPFSFSRASSATLFDKDKNMELVGNNIPRIDYGNYTGDVKLLVEKESTNLFRDSNLALNNNKTSGFDTLIDFDWHGCLLSTKASELRIDTGTSFYYKNYAIKADTPYSVSLFASLNAQEKPVIGSAYSVNTDGYLNLDNGGLSISSLFSGKNVYRFGRHRTSGASMSWSGIVKGTNTLNRKLSVSGYQLEEQENATSYIPTTTTTATRAADQLTYTLLQNSSVYLKTNKRETTLSKNIGLWNIHDDLNNEGIQILAII